MQEQKLKEEQEQKKDAAGCEIVCKNALNDIRQKIRNLAEITEQLETAAKEVKRLGMEQDNAQKKYDTKSSELQQQKEMLEQVSDAERREKQAETESIKVSEAIRRQDELEDKLEDWEKISKNREKAQKEYQKEVTAQKQISEHYRKMEQQFWDAQAGILAQGLKEEEPCPVCGSVHHPLPAVIPQETPERDELENAKAEDAKSREKVSRLSEKAHQLMVQEEEKISAVLKDAKELLGISDDKMSLAEIRLENQKQKNANEVQRQEYKSQKEKAKNDLDTKNLLEQKMQDTQNELTLLSEKKNALGQKNATAKERYTQQKQQWEKNIADYGFMLENTEDSQIVLSQLSQIERERNMQFLQAKKDRERVEQIAGELKESEESKQKIRVTISSIQEEIAKLTGNKETVEKQMRTDMQSVCGQADIFGNTGTTIVQKIQEAEHEQMAFAEDVIVMMQNAASEKQVELSKKQEKERKKAALEKQIPLDETEIKELTSQIGAAENEIIRLQTEYVNEEKGLKELKEQVEDITKEEVQSQIEKCTEQKKNLEENREKTRETYNNYEKNTESEKGAIQVLLGQIRETEKSIALPEEEIEKQAEELRTKRSEIEENRASKYTSYHANMNICENVSKKQKEIAQTEQKYVWMKSLSDTASGMLTGKAKIELETYVQMAYFDRILIRANRRMLTMSSGQYELQREEETGSRKEKAGLELCVVDHYNGTKRSVKTLSGGESFQASLSLALGLSDEIQSYAGGIRMDSMFVDEGFGSLDEDALEQALKALLQLTEGNRLVGIISHVSELKDQIDKKIIVTKHRTPEGVSSAAQVE